MQTESGIAVLDLGCGAGNYTNCIAEKYPNSKFTGLEYSPRGVELAQQTQKQKGLTNVNFVQGDAQDLPKEWTGQFDMIFIYDVLHDLPDPHKCIGEVRKVMKDGGCLSLVEMGFHGDSRKNAGDMNAALYYTASIFVCLASSLTEPPHVGYGACWGMENIEKALEKEKFNISEKAAISLIGKKAFYFCTK